MRIASIVVVMAIVVSALWLGISQVADTDVDIPEPPTAPGSPEASPPGTPPPATPPAATPEGAEEPAWPAGSLPDLLTYAPDRLADDSLPLNDVAGYANIAGWMSARGLAPPDSLADPGLADWAAELDSLAIPASLRERGLDPAWQSTYGFNLTQVDQVLIIGQAPDYVMIMRGSFDAEVLQAAWVASGYQAVEVEGATVWSLFPGDTIDLSAPASRPAMGTLNNVVLLDDGTLVAAAKTSRLGSTLEVVNGNAPPLADHDDIAPLLLPETGVERLASAVIAKGSLLQATGASASGSAGTPAAPLPGTIATPGAGAGMPAVAIMLLGIPVPEAAGAATPEPEEGAGQAVTMLVVLEEPDESRAGAGTIANRLRNGRSPVTGDRYSTRFADTDVRVLEAGERAVIMVTGVLVQGSTDWLEILASRDLGFAAWLPEE
jgi:hypothetical protein